MAKKNKKFIYQIVLLNHDSFMKVLYSTGNEEGVYNKFREMKEESDKVEYPILYNNCNAIVPAKYEIAILKCKQDGDKDITLIMDDTDSFQRYQTNDENWIILEKAPYNLSETFFVYGYHPFLQRKDFPWVFRNMISDKLKDRSTFLNLVVYKNKLLIDNSGELDMVICKNTRDAIRLFNTIEEKCKKMKLKRAIFMGDVAHSSYKRDWIDRIQELTGWDRRKITRNSTRP